MTEKWETAGLAALGVWIVLTTVCTQAGLSSGDSRAFAEKRGLHDQKALRVGGRPTSVVVADQSGPGSKFEQDDSAATRAASGSPAARLLQTAQRLLRQRDYVQAVQLLQRLLDQPDDTLLGPSQELASGQAASIKRQAEALLGQLPDEARAAYQLQFGQQAAHELAQSLSSGDRRRLLDVARRYFYTTSGREAAYRLASSYLDHGQFLAAAFWFQRLLQHEPPGPKRQLLRIKAVLAWLAAGEPGLANAVWHEGSWSVPSQWTYLAAELGQVSSFEQLANRVRRLWPAVQQVARSSDWLACRGDFARRCEAGPVNVTGPTVWTHSTLTDHERSHPWALRRLTGLQSLIVSYAAALHSRSIDANRPPAMHPIIVGGRVICRTVNSIQAFDLSSGRLLWQSVLLDPTLAEIARQLNNQSVQPRPMAERLLPAYLNQRWFFDTTAGTLSSDGRTVFAIEEAKLLGAQYLLASGINPGRLYFDGSNRLIALDALTGKIRWMVGGGEADRRMPLGGVFFLAPPAVRDGSLYCLANEGGDTRLLVLSAESGQLEWSLTLESTHDNAYSDLVWQYTGNGPSLYQNILICPVPGGCVAVDVDQQRPLWVYRYRKRSTYTPGNAQTQMLQAIRQSQLAGDLKGMQDRWLINVPVIAHGFVVLTPPDSDQLHCLRLVDGQLLWRRPREQGLFVAAVTKRNVVVVGHRQVVAWRLEDGEPAWPDRLNIPTPAGQGVRSGQIYHLPLATSEFLTFDLEDGQLLARSPVPGSPALGNLAAADGVVVVQSFDSVSAFRSVEQRRRELEGEGEQLGAEELAERGEFRLHLGHLSAGLTDVRRSLAMKHTPQAARLLRDRLFDELRRDVKSNWAALQELESLVETPEQLARLLQLKAEGLQRMGRTREAAEAYVQLALHPSSLADPSAELDRVASDDGLLTTRTDCWARARLSELYQQASPQQRQALDQWLWSQLQRIPADDLPRLRRFLSITTRLPIGITARRRLAELLAQRQPLSVERELHLWRLAKSNDAGAAAFARARLAELYLQTGHVGMAERLAAELERQPHQLAIDSKTTVTDWLAQWQTTALAAARSREQPSWPSQPLTVRQVSQIHAIERVVKLPYRPSSGSLFEGWRFQWRRQSESLVAVDGLGRPRWRLPLPNLMLGAMNFGRLSVANAAHLVVLSLGDRFLVLDTLAAERGGSDDLGGSTPRVLWGRLLLETTPRQAMGRLLQDRLVEHPGRGAVIAVDPLGRPIGRVTLLAPDLVCYQIGKTLYAAESVTGKTLWTRHGVPAGAEIFGDSEQVVLADPTSEELTFLRTDDGKLLRRKNFPLNAHQLTTVGRHLLTWRSDQVGAELALLDLQTDRKLWQQTFDPNSLVAMIGEDEVVVAERKGRAIVVSARTGQIIVEAKIPAIDRASHLFVMRGRNRYLLFFTSLDRSTLTHVIALPYLTDQIPLNGRIDALQRSTGRLLWSVAVDQTAVDIRQPPDLPVLVLACRRSPSGSVTDPNHMPMPTKPAYSLSVLDLRNGTWVFRDDKQPVMNGFAVRLADDGTTLEVLTDRTTLTLSFGGEAR